MLVLTRKVGEEVVLPSCGVTIGVIRVAGKSVRLGITAPREVSVRRCAVGAKTATGARESASADPQSIDCLAPRPSDGLVEAIRSRIVQRAGGRVRNLEVQASDGHIVVRGVTPSYYARQLVCAAVLEAFPPGDGDPADSIRFDIQVAPQ